MWILRPLVLCLVVLGCGDDAPRAHDDAAKLVISAGETGRAAGIDRYIVQGRIGSGTFSIELRDASDADLGTITVEGETMLESRWRITAGGEEVSSELGVVDADGGNAARLRYRLASMTEWVELHAIARDGKFESAALRASRPYSTSVNDQGPYSQITLVDGGVMADMATIEAWGTASPLATLRGATVAKLLSTQLDSTLFRALSDHLDDGLARQSGTSNIHNSGPCKRSFMEWKSLDPGFVKELCAGCVVALVGLLAGGLDAPLAIAACAACAGDFMLEVDILVSCFLAEQAAITLASCQAECPAGTVASLQTDRFGITDFHVCNCDCTAASCQAHCTNAAVTASWPPPTNMSTPLPATLCSATCDTALFIDDECECTLSYCGNNELENEDGCTETCDDGNTMDGDSCNSMCRMAVCGDEVVTPPETCDPPGTGTCDAAFQCGAQCGCEPKYLECYELRNDPPMCQACCELLGADAAECLQAYCP